MDDQNTVILKGRLNGKQRSKLNRLWDMLYSPKELAHEIGMNHEQIYRVYIPLGCPHERDGKSHILINGKAFCDWYKANYTKPIVTDNETFCIACQKPVKITNPIHKQKGELSYILCNCPNCGRTLSKITANTRGKNDQQE